MEREPDSIAAVVLELAVGFVVDQPLCGVARLQGHGLGAVTLAEFPVKAMLVQARKITDFEGNILLRLKINRHL